MIVMITKYSLFILLSVMLLSGGVFSSTNSAFATSHPTFSDATVNTVTGVSSITFSETIDYTTIDPTSIHIRESSSSTGGITLSASEITTTLNSDTISFTLNSANLVTLNALTTPTLYINSNAVQNTDGDSFEGSEFDITITSSVVASFNINSVTASPTSLTFSPDGTKMFVLGSDSDKVYTYTLNPPFDISTAYLSISSNTLISDASPTGLTFSPDGTNMFVIGTVDNKLHQYSLSAPFDVLNLPQSTSISTAAGKTFTDLAFSPDGTNMFVLADDNKVYQYTLDTAFDVTTVSTPTIISLSDGDEYIPTSFTFSPDGTNMFVIGNANDRVHQYTLSTAFDVTTVSTSVASFPVRGEDNSPTDITFSPDGTNMFMIGSITDTVYSYNIITPFSITLDNTPPPTPTSYTWIDQTSDVNQQMGDVFFIDAKKGWAVGASGTIIYTYNGGETWIEQTSGVTTYLNGVFFIDAKKGWAAGNGGTILSTVNGGNNWILQTTPITSDISGISFIDANIGWTVGNFGNTLYTTNGGGSWSEQTNAVNGPLYDVSFTDSNNGWAVGAFGNIVSTTDGGTSWSKQASGIFTNLNGVFFIDANNGWAVGSSGIILSTVDGGESWSEQTSGVSKYLAGVHFADIHNGWAVGDSGTVLYTYDGGESWSEQTPATDYNLAGVSYVDIHNGWAVGGSGTVIKGSDTVQPTISITTIPTTVNDTTFSVLGNVESGSTVEIFRGDTSLGEATVTGTSWSADITLYHGPNIITALATNTAGNTKLSGPVTITYAVAPPVITTSPSTVNTESFTIHGTSTNAKSVGIYDGSTFVGNVIPDGSGDWSFTVTLIEGENIFTAFAIDDADEISAESNSVTITLDITLDTTPPTITVTESSYFIEVGGIFTPFTFSASDDTDGDISGDVAVSGDTVDVNTTATYTITFNVSDAAGNAADTITRTVTVMAAPPVITTQPSTVNTESFTLSGTSTNAKSVGISDGTSFVGNVTPDGSGNWSFTVTLSEGVNTFMAVTIDNADNTSEPSDSVTITLDTTKPIITIGGDLTLTQNVDTFTDDYSANDNVDGDITNDVVITGDTVDTTTVGTYTITYDVTDTAGNAADTVTRTVTVSVDDTTKPIITIGGDLTLTQNVDTFTDDYSANDNVDGDITNDVVITGDAVDTTTTGSYTITYDVTDAAGNAADTVTRTVTVVPADITPPVIALVGESTIDITIDTTYSDEGATALDNIDGNITGSITTVSTVNTALLGTYTITYNVSDTAGNAADEITRTVNVVPAPILDTTKPIITIGGDLTLTQNVDTFTDDYSANDNVDGDITSSVVITGDAVDVTSVGIYTITYNVSDDANNAADTVTRTVTVSAADTTKPIITVNEPSYSILLGGIFTPFTFSANDNVDGDITGDVVISGDTVDVNTTGSYTIIYNVSDDANNTADTITRTVTVDPVVTVEPVKKKKSGGGCSGDCTPPTFGKDKYGKMIVQGGFSLDGNIVDVTKYHTEYPLIELEIGQNSTITLKSYDNGGVNNFKWFQIGFGMPQVGSPFNDAEVLLTVYLNNTGIDHTEIINGDNLIEFTNYATSIESCGYVVSECRVITIDFIPREQLFNNVMSIQTVDKSRNAGTNHLNDGVEFTGDSLNPPQTDTMWMKHSSQERGIYLDLTEIDKFTNLWEDNNGYLWILNDHNSWFQITKPDFTRNVDPDTLVMTRIHSEYVNLLIDEQNKATLIFDSSKLESIISESFSYDYPVIDRDLSKLDKLSDKLQIEESKAHAILDMMFEQPITYLPGEKYSEYSIIELQRQFLALKEKPLISNDTFVDIIHKNDMLYISGNTGKVITHENVLVTIHYTTHVVPFEIPVNDDGSFDIAKMAKPGLSLVTITYDDTIFGKYG